jgi:hypothetical protein
MPQPKPQPKPQSHQPIEQLLEQIQAKGLFLVNLFQLSGEETLGLWQANVGDKKQNWAFARAETAPEALAQALAKALNGEAGLPVRKQQNKWAKAQPTSLVPAAVDMEELGL